MEEALRAEDGGVLRAEVGGGIAGGGWRHDKRESSSGQGTGKKRNLVCPIRATSPLPSSSPNASPASPASASPSTAVTSHRLILPSAPAAGDDPLSYIPYSDGFDGKHDPDKYARGDYYDRLNADAAKSLSAIVGDLAAAGRPVNCVIYSCFSTWAAVVARKHGIQSVLLWKQPATAFAAYWHFFHGLESLVSANAGDRYFSVRFPDMPPLRICDLPSLLTVSKEDDRACHLGPLRDMCAIMDSEQSVRGRVWSGAYRRAQGSGTLGAQGTGALGATREQRSWNRSRERARERRARKHARKTRVRAHKRAARMRASERRTGVARARECASERLVRECARKLRVGEDKWKGEKFI
ncbi:hypothetical protein KSP39_PZI017580 [Platanthera zijinensis]|uniref:Uncharacterized protein n=1 Tax=Platanthera zijinensis TaxID=2320716 RepID=A0AAP0B4V0_9ASPA